jgi:hypothetical protein
MKKQKLKAERLYVDKKNTNYGLEKVFAPEKPRFSMRVRARARWLKIWWKVKRPLFLIVSMTKYRHLLTLLNIDMKIKYNQTSTKAGIVLLTAILALLGVNAEQEFLTENIEKLVEGAVLMVGSLTALYSILKDDEKGNDVNNDS